MIRRLITNIERSLAKKITTWVMVSLFLLIIFIISGALWITTTFYQEHLEGEVDERLNAHANLLKVDQNDDILEYLNQLEMGKNSHIFVVDEALNPRFSSENVTKEKKDNYTRFIEEHRRGVSTNHHSTTIEEIDTSMAFHIPHVWGLSEIRDDAGETIGYVFIDQDTVELNNARLKLLLLLLLMGILTLISGYWFVRYLTRRISNPLNEMSLRTQDIAKGNFDIVIHSQGKDEIGMLGSNIQQMTDQLKEYRDSRREFISHVSHDLRTPITYIKGYSSLMKDADKVDVEGWKRNLQVIYEEAKRMERLVSDLFLLTKLEEGKIQLQFEPVEMEEWLTNLFQSRSIMFDQKQIQSKLTIDTSLLNSIVFFDPFRMEQAIINVLENAIRFTNIYGEIRLSSYTVDSMLAFKISDTGEGMEEEKLDLIWERFYKADSSRSRDDSGTGIGLAIVKEIVETHHGNVRVESEKGVGTHFFLFIPLVKKE